MPARSLTIVLPAYNEADRLGPALDELFGYLHRRGERARDGRPGAGHLPPEIDVLVVDDGSADGTAASSGPAPRRRRRPRLLACRTVARAPPSGPACSRAAGDSSSSPTPTWRPRPTSCRCSSGRSRRSTPPTAAGSSPTARHARLQPAWRRRSAGVPRARLGLGRRAGPGHPVRVQGLPPRRRPRPVRAPEGHLASSSTSRSSSSPAGAATRIAIVPDPLDRPARLAHASGPPLALRVAWDLFRIPLAPPRRPTAAREPRRRRPDAGANRRLGAALVRLLAGRRDRRHRVVGVGVTLAAAGTRSATTSWRTAPPPRASSTAARRTTAFDVAGGFGLFLYPPTVHPLVLPIRPARARRGRRGPGSTLLLGCASPSGGAMPVAGARRVAHRAARRRSRGPSSTRSSSARSGPSCCSCSPSAGDGWTGRGPSARRRARRGDQDPAGPAPRLGAADAPLAGAGAGLASLSCSRVATIVAGPRRGDFIALVAPGRRPITTPHNFTPGRRALAGSARRGRSPSRCAGDHDRVAVAFVASACGCPSRSSYWSRSSPAARLADALGPLRDRAAPAGGVAARSRPSVGGADAAGDAILLVGLCHPGLPDRVWDHPRRSFSRALGAPGVLPPPTGGRAA